MKLGVKAYLPGVKSNQQKKTNSITGAGNVGQVIVKLKKGFDKHLFREIVHVLQTI